MRGSNGMNEYRRAGIDADLNTLIVPSNSNSRWAVCTDMAESGVSRRWKEA